MRNLFWKFFCGNINSIISTNICIKNQDTHNIKTEHNLACSPFDIFKNNSLNVRYSIDNLKKSCGKFYKGKELLCSSQNTAYEKSIYNPYLAYRGHPPKYTNKKEQNEQKKLNKSNNLSGKSNRNYRDSLNPDQNRDANHDNDRKYENKLDVKNKCLINKLKNKFLEKIADLKKCMINEDNILIKERVNDISTKKKNKEDNTGEKKETEMLGKLEILGRLKIDINKAKFHSTANSWQNIQALEKSFFVYGELNLYDFGLSFQMLSLEVFDLDDLPSSALVFGEMSELDDYAIITIGFVDKYLPDSVKNSFRDENNKLNKKKVFQYNQRLKIVKEVHNMKPDEEIIFKNNMNLKGIPNINSFLLADSDPSLENIFKAPDFQKKSKNRFLRNYSYEIIEFYFTCVMNFYKECHDSYILNKNYDSCIYNKKLFIKKIALVDEKRPKAFQKHIDAQQKDFLFKLKEYFKNFQQQKLESINSKSGKLDEEEMQIKILEINELQNKLKDYTLDKNRRFFKNTRLFKKITDLGLGLKEYIYNNIFKYFYSE